MDYLTFTTLYGINLAIRFPLDQIDNVDTATIESVAKFSARCVPLGLDAWTNEYSQNNLSQVRRQRPSYSGSQRPVERAA